MSPMPSNRYRPFPAVDLPDRRWPSARPEAAPQWCSVDLRDGNQALVEPMGVERKLRLFQTLVDIGFKEIEVGFPSASAPDHAFVRRIVEEGRIPDDVTIQVLTQARDELIDRTLESLRGARRAIVHLYNSTSTLQRRVVFGLDREGIRDIAVRGAQRIREAAARIPETEIVLEYSPESFTGTEPDFAVEVCAAVMAVWQPTREAPMIVNLPATVEMSSPNLYADQIEWFARHIPRRDTLVLSVHPHNDRGTAVAAAELGLLAGADRVEGTLFGNGERTGNVDVVTLALNLHTQGIDPQLDVSDIDSLVKVSEHCTRLPVHPRHPYAGELVYTAFSGSHQDAIRKGMADQRTRGEASWEVPYLPIDPADVGRNYEAVIRINSQSGKSGVAYVLEQDHGLRLPRAMAVDLSGVVQARAESEEGELNSEAIHAIFEGTYVRPPQAVVVDAHRVHPDDDSVRIEVDVRSAGGALQTLHGSGSGPLAAFASALCEQRPAFSVVDYSEHALGEGEQAEAVAYVCVEGPGGERVYGAGRHASILRASLSALGSAVGRLQAGGLAAAE